MSQAVLEKTRSLAELFTEEAGKAPIIKSENEEVLSSDDYQYELNMRIDGFNDDGERKKFVNSCKRFIRSSPEYREWTKYLREILGQYVCKITGENNAQTTVDIHHHPISISTIIDAVVERKISRNEKFTSFNICEEVLQLHFNNQIGFVPLVSSIHEKYHNGFIEIPMELVQGNYESFLAEFEGYIDDDTRNTIAQRLLVNKGNCGWSAYWKLETKDSE